MSVTEFTFINVGGSKIKAFNVNENNREFRSVDGVLYSKDMMCLYAFPNGHQMTEYTLPRTVIEIYSPFIGCDNIVRFKVEAGNVLFSADENGLLYDGSKTTLYGYPLGKDGAIVTSGSVTDYKSRVLYGADITDYTISNNVTDVGSAQFMNSSLETVTLGKNLNTIGFAMFIGCDSLKSIKITTEGDRLYIKSFAFRGLDEVNYESGRSGYSLKVYYDKEITREYDKNDTGYVGFLYLQWNEIPADDDDDDAKIPLIIGSVIGIALLASLGAYLFLRRKL